MSIILYYTILYYAILYVLNSILFSCISHIIALKQLTVSVQ